MGGAPDQDRAGELVAQGILVDARQGPGRGHRCGTRGADRRPDHRIRAAPLSGAGGRSGNTDGGGAGRGVAREPAAAARVGDDRRSRCLAAGGGRFAATRQARLAGIRSARVSIHVW